MSEMQRGRRCGRRPEVRTTRPVERRGAQFPEPVLAALPDVLTVEEAARYLRIGRASAYELARRFRETDGREGLPVIVLGRSLRVPRHALEHLVALDRQEGQHRRPESSGDGAA